MHIRELLWDDYRVEHIAQHNVDIDEVRAICDDPYHLAKRDGKNRYLVLGQTQEVRYLVVVLESVGGSVYRPITARDMKSGEKQSFRRLNK